MKTEKLPLTMGQKVIGWVTLDYDTGEVQGVLDKKLVPILNEFLGASLLEMSFFGRPGFGDEAIVAGQKKFKDYINEKDVNLTEREAKQVVFDRLSDQEIKLLMFDDKFDTGTFDWESFWVRYRRNI